MKARLLALGLGSVVAIVSGEVLARVLDLAPKPIYIEKWRMRLSENLDMVYEPKPDMSAEGQDMQYYLYPDKSNDLGFRGKSPARTKKSKGVRIIVLGDSVVAGIWVSNPEHLMTAKLEEKLEKIAPNAEVLNFGVPGYNTRQEIAILEDRGANLRPNLVILGYCLNDQSVDNGGVVDHLRNEGILKKPPLRSLLRDWSALASACLSALDSHLGYSQSSPQSPEDCLKIDKENSPDSSFEKFKLLSDKYNFTPVVVIFPDFDDLASHGCRNSKTLTMRLEVEESAKAAGLKVFDLCADFELAVENYLGSPMAYDKYHLNLLGHEVAANIIFDKIKNYVIKE